MERLGILTFHAAHSFGAVLQCCALQETLQSLAGNRCAVGVIPYVPAEHRHHASFYQPIRRQRIRFFQNFLDEHLRLGGPPAWSLAEAVRAGGFTRIVVGSDQVWNPDLIRSAWADYFLPGIDGVRKDAYAASFGGATLPQTLQENPDIRAALADFTAISVREESAIGLCRQLGRADAVPVLDPLLLPPIDFHQRLAEAAPAEPAAAGGICGFFLREQPADAALARRAARTLALPARIVASKCPLFSPLRHDRLASIPHFVRALRDAALVMTNSFHAVVLCIVFQRPFAYVGNAVHPERAERITSLLHKLGLEGRTLRQETPIGPDLLQTGDLQAATLRLEPLRRQSLDFLHAILPN